MLWLSVVILVTVLQVVGSLQRVPTRVVVSGGCHGNELTGVWVLSRLQQRAAAIAEAYPMLRVETLLANPRAHADNVRFIDCDLNRQFSQAALIAPPESYRSRSMGIDFGRYETTRAREISAKFGPKGAEAQAADLCIDLHTTTANMGCTLIVGSWCHPALAAASYVAQQWLRGDDRVAQSFPLRVLIDPHHSKEDCPYLCSVARHGIEIEVGPCAQGLLRADVAAATERAVTMLFEFFDRLSSGDQPALPPTLEAFVDKGKLAWPAGKSGALPGVIVHPNLQDRDFEKLVVGDPLWLALDGTVTPYAGQYGDEVYPVFINEAAYYHSASGLGIGICEPVVCRLMKPQLTPPPPPPAWSSPAVEIQSPRRVWQQVEEY